MVARSSLHQSLELGGCELLRKFPLSAAFLATVSHGPGVYQMLGGRSAVRVGKARDLRKRLAQYAHFAGPVHSKTAVMLSHVRRVETVAYHTEKEALILEASLINSIGRDTMSSSATTKLS